MGRYIMSRIVAVGTSLPPYILRQEEISEFARRLFSNSFRDIDRLLPVFQNSQVEMRHFCVPLEWFGEPHSFAEKNSLYQECALRLSVEAIKDCLEKAGRTAQEVDHIFFVSTTGMATPSIDSRIINEMGMNIHTKRTPVWGLGCAGGAAGLSRAKEYTTAYPESHALLVAVECCGLTFQHEDKSKSNLVATSIFADGAAAVLIEGDKCEGRTKGPEILHTMSTLWPETEDVMGWDINEHGLKVIFSRDIPSLVDKLLKPNIHSYLEMHQLQASDITHFITHPGGRKVIEAYAEALEINIGRFAHALDILRRCGNMSSVTVLFVLKAFLEKGIGEGELGLITALGPGFSSELLLIRG